LYGRTANIPGKLQTQPQPLYNFDPLWKGPYEIKKIEGSNAIIQEVGKRKHQTVHINRLKPYFSSLSENPAT
jgi:hypothetical protein